jgi:hypothetical protein
VADGWSPLHRGHTQTEESRVAARAHYDQPFDGEDTKVGGGCDEEPRLKLVAGEDANASIDAPPSAPYVPARADGDFVRTPFELQDLWAEEIGAYGIAVWLAIARHVDYHKGTCFPSVRTIARLAGCKDRTVRNTINRLVEVGLLHKQPRYRRFRQRSERDDDGANGREVPNTSNLYRLCDPLDAHEAFVRRSNRF